MICKEWLLVFLPDSNSDLSEALNRSCLYMLTIVTSYLNFCSTQHICLSCDPGNQNMCANSQLCGLRILYII